MRGRPVPPISRVICPDGRVAGVPFVKQKFKHETLFEQTLEETEKWGKGQTALSGGTRNSQLLADYTEVPCIM